MIALLLIAIQLEGIGPERIHWDQTIALVVIAALVIAVLVWAKSRGKWGRK